MWRILHHRGHHPASISRAKTTRLRGRGIFRFTPHEQRAPLQRFQHIYALFFYGLFSLDYVFVRDFECFFFPSHDYLKRTKHPLREYAILFSGKGVYLSWHADFASGAALGKSPLLVAVAFVLVHLIVGLTVSLVFQTTHTVDSTYFPSDRSEFENGVYHIFATTLPIMRLENPLVGWLAGGAEPSHRPSSVPVCVPHALCSADPHRAGDRCGVWSSLSPTSHNDAGDPASSDPFEAPGQRGLTMPLAVPVVSRLAILLPIRVQCAGNPVQVLSKYSEVYGDTFRFYLGGLKEAIVTTNPTVIQHVLEDQCGQLSKKSEIQVKRMGHFLGKGLLTTHGEAWRTQRRLIQKGFDRKQLEVLSSIMQDSLADSLRDFDRQTQIGPVDIYPQLMKITFGMVARSLFGARLKDEDIGIISHTISTVQEFMVRQTIQPYLNPWFSISRE